MHCFKNCTSRKSSRCSTQITSSSCQSQLFASGSRSWGISCRQTTSFSRTCCWNSIVQRVFSPRSAGNSCKNRWHSNDSPSSFTQVSKTCLKSNNWTHCSRRWLKASKLSVRIVNSQFNCSCFRGSSCWGWARARWLRCSGSFGHICLMSLSMYLMWCREVSGTWFSRLKAWRLSNLCRNLTLKTSTWISGCSFSMATACTSST